MNDIQSHLLIILKEFIRVAEKHHLRWWANAGTALGAVRHKGFIPWDDDIDVMLPREDYEKFLKLQYEYEGTPFFIQTWQKDPHYPYCFAKLRDSSTTYIESYYPLNRMNHGLWIDIFPIDGMSYKDKPREKCAGRIKYVWYMTYMSYPGNLLRSFHSYTFFKDLALNFVGCLGFMLNPFHVRQRAIEKHVRHLVFNKSKLVGCYFDFDTKHAAMDKDIFDDFVMMPFEDVKVKIPKNYDKYLTMLYGDYMTPPPVEKQVGQHKNKGCDLNVGYKEYMKNHRM